MGAYKHALLCQILLSNRTGKYQRCRQSAAKVATASHIVTAAILYIGRIIAVGGSRYQRHIAIVTAAGILIGNLHGQRRTGGAPIQHTGENMRNILFQPGGGGFVTPRGTPSHILINGVQIHRDTGRQTVNHTADGRTVALTKNTQLYLLTCY